ncbi:hypothetical protein GCM10027610_124390 [Dactylosporangium cerinum]
MVMTAPTTISALPPAPQADYDLDLRSLEPYLAIDEDGDPVLVLRDGDTVVVLEFGLGGHALLAAINATAKLSAAVDRYAGLLHDLREPTAQA